jgi:hypothetical protein
MVAKLTRLTHKIATQLHLVTAVPFAVLAPGRQSGNFWIHPRTVTRITATGWKTGVQFPAEVWILSLRYRVHSHRASYPMRAACFFSAGEAPGHKTGHSPPTSVFMAWCLVKYRNNFTFRFIVVISLTGRRFIAISSVDLVRV